MRTGGCRRDYKRVGAADKPAQRALSGWRFGFPAGIAIGIVFGAVASNFYHATYRAPAQEITALAQPPPAPTESEREQRDYEFFEILPGMEVEVPEVDGADVRPPDVYDVQVASFRARKQAETALEKLEAMDLEPQMQTVEVGNGETWYLLRLGPYDRRSRVNNVRIRLIKAGFDPLVKKR